VGTTVPSEVLGETTTTLPTTVLPVVAGVQAVPVSTAVTSTSPGLAYTGSSSWLILLIGTSLFLGGFVLLGSRRRLIAASED
jgi:LPXTG-motif cell wall-anchored protein